MIHDSFDFPDFDTDFLDVAIEPFDFDDIDISDLVLNNHEIGESDVPAYLKPSQRRFLLAYVSVPGNISNAALRAGIARRTFYNWYENNPGFREAFINIGADIEDFVKAKLMQKIIEGDTRAIIFYLKTYGGPKWDSSHTLRRRSRRTCGCLCNCAQFSLKGRQGRPGNAFTN